MSRPNANNRQEYWQLGRSQSVPGVTSMRPVVPSHSGWMVSTPWSRLELIARLAAHRCPSVNALQCQLPTRLNLAAHLAGCKYLHSTKTNQTKPSQKLPNFPLLMHYNPTSTLSHTGLMHMTYSSDVFVHLWSIIINYIYVDLSSAPTFEQQTLLPSS